MSQFMRYLKAHAWKWAVCALLLWIGAGVRELRHDLGVVKYMLVDASCKAK